MCCKNHYYIILVIDNPIINETGMIVYPILVDGTVQEMPAASLSKRKPKEQI